MGQHTGGNSVVRVRIESLQDGNMRKIIALAIFSFALMAGTATMVTIHPQRAFADPDGGGGGQGGGN